MFGQNITFHTLVVDFHWEFWRRTYRGSDTVPGICHKSSQISPVIADTINQGPLIFWSLYVYNNKKSKLFLRYVKSLRLDT